MATSIHNKKCSICTISELIIMLIFVWRIIIGLGVVDAERVGSILERCAVSRLTSKVVDKLMRGYVVSVTAGPS
jgi:hypothetical protein